MSKVKVYLSGGFHSAWAEEVRKGVGEEVIKKIRLALLLPFLIPWKPFFGPH